MRLNRRHSTLFLSWRSRQADSVASCLACTIPLDRQRLESRQKHNMKSFPLIAKIKLLIPTIPELASHTE